MIQSVLSLYGGMDMIQSISSLLCDPMPSIEPQLKILLSVTISKDGKFAFSKLPTERGTYFTVNPKTHITIRYTPKDTPWDKHHQIIVNQRNIFQLRSGLRSFYRNFQRDGLYRYDDKGMVSELLTEDEDIVIIPMTMGQLLRLSPSVVTDRKGTVYPGVQLTINREENQVDLSIDEFEGFYDLFLTINMYQSGLTLLQTYIGMRKISIEDTIDSLEKQKQPKTNPYTGSGSIFGKKQEEYVKAPPTRTQPKTLDDL